MNELQILTFQISIHELSIIFNKWTYHLNMCIKSLQKEKEIFVAIINKTPNKIVLKSEWKKFYKKKIPIILDSKLVLAF